MSSIPKTKTVTVERLYERLEADFENGLLYYKPIGSRSWDTQNAGKSCFNTNGGEYLIGRVDKVRLYKHRVLVAMHNGHWPDKVDHINGNTLDNRISNLRAVSEAENRRNCRRYSRNSSGHNGVSWSKRDARWLVRICHDYKQIYLGLYESLDEAIRVRKEADIKYGFHENHGRKPQRKV